MIRYIFDGSFEGLLTCIYESYYQSLKPDYITSHKNLQENFFSQDLLIKTDLAKYKKVFNSIQEKISRTALEEIYHAYLSEQDDIFNWIYEYIRFGFRVGKELVNYLVDDRVLIVHKAGQKVLSEAHRMVGLLRFKRINHDIYYAVIEPDHNILPLIAPHFAERFTDQYWVIDDIKRNMAVIYNKKNWVIKNHNEKLSSSTHALPDIDSDYEVLWKTYYRHISIPSRKNIKLQRSNMPARYWKHLTEKTL